MVYLKLQPFRQNSVSLRKNLKLSSRFYGPFKVLEKIGEVAYRLDLPESSRIHPVFHVSLLKKCISPKVTPLQNLPATDEDGDFKIAPLRVLGHRQVMRRGTTVDQALIGWCEADPSISTWEDVKFLRRKFPFFDPWGQGSIHPRGIVMAVEESKREDGRGGKAIELSLEDLGIVKSKDENERIGFGPKLLFGAASG